MKIRHFQPKPENRKLVKSFLKLVGLLLIRTLNNSDFIKSYHVLFDSIFLNLFLIVSLVSVLRALLLRGTSRLALLSTLTELCSSNYHYY